MLYSPEQLIKTDKQLLSLIGGKGKNILTLMELGLTVPKSFFISSHCYDRFIDHNNLREKIELELHRKDFNDMRWEEIWDIALRIQNLFLQGQFPADLALDIEESVTVHFCDKPLVVRSSSPGEDDKSNSFAGLHQSYVNVKNGPELLGRVKSIWASLWSDRAILYRQELGLNVLSSSMAVVVQELVAGSCSGVVFSQNPLENSQLVIEAVYGLNQGLVDGEIEPDRWKFSRADLQLIEHHMPERLFFFTRFKNSGVIKEKISPVRSKQPPLTSDQLQELAVLSLKLEKSFSSPQDIEWTYTEDRLVILQTRPITVSSKPSASDKRSWYLSLTRSYENLLRLWEMIEGVHLPAMDADSEAFSQIALDDLTDLELVSELRKRDEANSKWTKIYWDEFIPFAHGARLLGELYNELIKPEDPFEFVQLLMGQRMLSTERNKILHECAELIKSNSSYQLLLAEGRLDQIDDKKLKERIELLEQQFAMANQVKSESLLIPAMILQYAKLDEVQNADLSGRREEIERKFLEKVTKSTPFDPSKFLEMARASYRLRDDDNIHIGRINQELERAIENGMKRFSDHQLNSHQHLALEELIKFLEGEELQPAPANEKKKSETVRPESRVMARQLQGQAASSGISRGRARVIKDISDFTEFEHGEILVIDSIDPTMTFFAPLAGGIVERRGGMLVHGAIIAREYGVPCITGVSGATSYIKTGDFITVDGYLGICTIQRS